jgi:hypothetical protein
MPALAAAADYRFKATTSSSACRYLRRLTTAQPIRLTKSLCNRVGTTSTEKPGELIRRPVRPPWNAASLEAPVDADEGYAQKTHKDTDNFLVTVDG